MNRKSIELTEKQWAAIANSLHKWRSDLFGNFNAHTNNEWLEALITARILIDKINRMRL